MKNFSQGCVCDSIIYICQKYFLKALFALLSTLQLNAAWIAQKLNVAAMAVSAFPIFSKKSKSIHSAVQSLGKKQNVT